MRVTMTTSTATQASSATTDALLTLEGVSKIYGDLHALDNVSLEIPRGQWVSIVGPSGSGKTTLMNIVGAMDTATKGTVMLDGHDISDLTADELTEVRCRTIGHLLPAVFHSIKTQTKSSTSIKFMAANYPFEVTGLNECFLKSFPDLLLL